MDNNDVLNKGSKLLQKLNEEKKDVTVINNSDPFFVLRTDILAFFRHIMAETQQKDTLKNELEVSFLEDIRGNNEEEITFQQKITLYKLISTQSNIAAEGILSLFKPTPGAPSLLAENISKDKELDKFDEIYEGMSSDELQKVQKFMTVMSKVYSSNLDDKEEDGNDSNF